MAAKKTRKPQRAAFNRDMYQGIPFCESCFAHHAGECPTYTPASAYKCPCEFRAHAGLKCVAGAQHPSKVEAT